MEATVNLEKKVESKIKFEHPILHFLPGYSFYRSLKSSPKWVDGERNSAIGICLAKDLLYVGFIAYKIYSH
ncbi:MAG TPA: hypothetical protein VJB94_04665 [Candidatus Nanoarchaeia archaeon]|nr:hypothetical protein [Candidatus Nanoarchaeia archaeon]